MRVTSPSMMLAAAMLAGCAHQPHHIASLSESELQNVQEFELCGAYGVTGSERIRGEIGRRNLIPADQWEMVTAHQVAAGMSKCAVLAALGYPDDSSPASNGSTQLVYLNSLFVRVYLIEVRDGVAERITR